MSKLKIASIVILAVICGYLNRGIVFSGNSNAEDDESEFEADENDETDSELAHAINGAPTIVIPGQTPNWKDHTRKVSGHSNEQDSATQTVLRELLKKLESQESAQNPFRFRSATKKQLQVSPNTNSEPSSSTEALNAELLKKQRALELAARKQVLRRELDQLLKSPCHAILMTPKGGVARIAGFNLRVGDYFPGSLAQVKTIKSDRLVFSLEGEEATVYLTPGKPHHETEAESDDADEEKSQPTIQRSRTTIRPSAAAPAAIKSTETKAQNHVK